MTFIDSKAKTAATTPNVRRPSNTFRLLLRKSFPKEILPMMLFWLLQLPAPA